MRAFGKGGIRGIGAGLLGIGLLLVTTVGTQARDDVPGPVPATVVSVIDGDTMRVEARIWLGQAVEILVRLDGVDAPELRGRCREEKEMAQAARSRLAAAAGAEVRLHDVKNGKYAGRVVARVTTPEGVDLGTYLVAIGMARRYDGGPRRGWCDDKATRR